MAGLLLLQCLMFYVSHRGVAKFTQDMLFATKDAWTAPFDYGKEAAKPSSSLSIADHVAPGAEATAKTPLLHSSNNTGNNNNNNNNNTGEGDGGGGGTSSRKGVSC
jgi:hypothetical protein